MSNQATNTAAAAAPAKAKKPSIVDTFLKGCAKGFKVGIENITPAMILGYVLVYILKETGLMDILGTVMSPVMGLFGLPGEAFAVLTQCFSRWFLPTAAPRFCHGAASSRREDTR